MKKLQVIWDRAYSPVFPLSHRFPMRKFALLRDWVDEKYNASVSFNKPSNCSLDTLSLAHDLQYIEAFQSGLADKRIIRRIGLPWSQGLAKRSILAVGGTVLTAELALSHGVASHLAGGTHHASRDCGSGFCIYNDLAVAGLHLIKNRNIGRVLIFDCDVHQGDGTATILSNEKCIFTCSIHCGANFPVKKSNSDLDIDLPKGLEDMAYLKSVFDSFDAILQTWYPEFVLYDAGVDVHRSDSLGFLCVTDQGLFDRDFGIISRCLENNIPVATVIGGGYDSDHYALAARHGIVIKAVLHALKLK